MKSVAVLGGGPAGAFAAEQLAKAGVRTVLLDEKLAWEKPCGGGLTYKAYSQYPFLIENDTPKKLISQTYLSSTSGGTARLDLRQPLLIYSRFELNRMLLERADRAGAALEKNRVLGLERTGKGWRIRTRSGMLETDFCIVATGARNPLREVGTEWSARNTMTTLGYFIPAEQHHVDIQFFRAFEGYIWIFPRQGHLSAGIAGRGHPTRTLRTMLERYLDEKGISRKDATYYGHVLPSLERPEWKSNRVAGEGWLAVGDAAGLVDPVTGEGLYYAVRSADLAVQSLLSRREACAAEYKARISKEFVQDLEIGARLAKRLFLGRFLYNDTTARMIQFMRRSPSMCDIMQDLFAGTQGYLDLKERLKHNLSGTAREILMSYYFQRVVPDAR